MSQAFVKDTDEILLQDVPPSITALIVYLSRENNGIRVYNKNVVKDTEHNREVYIMSNGLSYAKDEQSKWYVI